jgi:dienelactone hydrolase
MRFSVLIPAIPLCLILARAAQDRVQPKTVELAAKDGLSVTADLYAVGDKKKPFLLLCHQARSSRGEYRAIAPRLVKAGFNCLALDQRSGRGLPKVSGGVKNETAARAAEAGKPTGYLDARADIEAAIAWIRKQGYTGKLTLWGSSYSASLALMIGAESKKLSAVIAFSPGDYLRPRGTVAKAAARLKVPLLVVAPENEREQATTLFEAAASRHKTLMVDPRNLHGSRTLFLADDPKPAWKAVLEFLEKHGR